MKISCCCLTCLIGEDPEEEPEERRLIPDKEPQDEPSFESPPASRPTRRDKETEPYNDKHPSGIESGNLRRGASIAQHYHIDSTKYSIDEDVSQELLIRLRVALKIMTRSDMVKIFAIEVGNVVGALKKIASTESSAAEDKPVVQLRTKLLPSEMRGHSRKYEVSEGITGSLKFHNECLHTVSISEFKSSSIRFRLYNVFRHQRDSLLGEYVVVNNNLSIDYESSIVNIELLLHEPSASDVIPPEICETRTPRSSVASSSQDEEDLPASFKKTIRRGDTRTTHRLPIPTFQSVEEEDEDQRSQVSEPGHDETSKSKKLKRSILKSLHKHSPEKVSSESGTDDTIVKQKKEKVDPKTALEWLRQGGHERTEKVGELRDATADLEKSADELKSNSVKLREKYEKKRHKKRSGD